MAGRLTAWGAGEILRTFFGRTSGPPLSFYLAFIRTTPPTLYINGAELDEPVDGGYARAEIVNDVGYWTDNGQLNVIVNQQDVEFGVATADWGPIGFWALTNAPYSGNVYAVGDIENSSAVYAGDVPTIMSGDISFTLGPFYTTEET